MLYDVFYNPKKQIQAVTKLPKTFLNFEPLAPTTDMLSSIEMLYREWRE